MRPRNLGRGYASSFVLISCQSGNRPSCRLEKTSSPSRLTSNTPPHDCTSSTSAAGNAPRIRSSSLEARGRYPQELQYSMRISMSASFSTQRSRDKLLSQTADWRAPGSGLRPRYTGIRTRYTGLRTRYTGIRTPASGPRTRYTGRRPPTTDHRSRRDRAADGAGASQGRGVPLGSGLAGG